MLTPFDFSPARAWAIQNPGAQAEVALVLIGSKGAGKGTLVRCLQRIFGRHAFQVTSREEVIGRFNGHLQDCVLFIADEAYWGGDKRCVGRLQGMITEPPLPIERKGIDLIQVPNYLHVLMLAEPGWVIPAGRYERRYAALAVSAVRRGDKEYFRRLHRQIAEGGAEAMFYDLGRMDLDDWHPREIPEALLSNRGSRFRRWSNGSLCFFMMERCLGRCLADPIPHSPRACLTMPRRGFRG
jgi:energy-coupling factor transporter ATP-binding protein EcfA2